MAIRRLNNSMSIISELSDEPNDVDGLSAEALKAKFDAAGGIIKEFMNNSLIPDVEAEIVKSVSETAVQSGNMPMGGAREQALVKKSDDSYDWDFRTLHEIPSGGVKAQVLMKSSGEDHDVHFGDAPPIDWALLASYTSADTYTWTAPDAYGDGQPYEIGVFIAGGGGSGGAASIVGTMYAVSASGGGSGFTRVLRSEVTPGNTRSIVIGAGANGVSAAAGYTQKGNTGGSSSFAGNVALGGDGGTGAFLNGSAYAFSANGGQGSDTVYSTSLGFTEAPAMGRAPQGYVSNTVMPLAAAYVTPIMCFNPFDGKRLLGAGGGAIASGATSLYTYQTAPALDDGLSAGRGDSGTGARIGVNATSPGSGGGACATQNASGTLTATSGKGADGAVFIYVRRAVR